jgi:hypothetical protein
MGLLAVKLENGNFQCDHYFVWTTVILLIVLGKLIREQPY